MADSDTSKTVELRNAFYGDGRLRVLTVLILLVIANLGFVGLLGYVLITPQEDKYFASTDDGRVIPLYPLSAPVVTSAELVQWATVAATSVNTYNFVNWRKALQTASTYFTPTGWREYQRALKSTDSLKTIIDKKLTVTAVATGAPVILDKGVLEGVYKWKVQMPLLITYESASAVSSQKVVVTMLVTRVSTLETFKGIQIDAFYTAEQAPQGTTL